MTPQTQLPPVEQTAETHAQHVVAGDMAAIEQDCVPDLIQAPEDLYDQLQSLQFERYAIVGHARIGWQHVFKVRYFGPTTVTLHHRLGDQDGKWMILESEQIDRRE